MKHAMSIGLFFYCTILALLIATSSIASGMQMKTTLPVALLFLPVPLYFVAQIVEAIVRPKQSSLVQVHIGKSGVVGVLAIFFVLVGAGAFSVFAYQSTAVVSPLSETPAQVLFPKWTKEATGTGRVQK